MADLFDITKCPVPALPALTDSRILMDCSVPAAPQPIYQCPDIDFDVPLPAPEPAQGADGPPGDPGDDGLQGLPCTPTPAGGAPCSYWIWCGPTGLLSSVSVSASASSADGCPVTDFCVTTPGEWILIGGSGKFVPTQNGRMEGEISITCDCAAIGESSSSISLDLI
jgi:hypothetical protein